MDIIDISNAVMFHHDYSDQLNQEDTEVNIRTKALMSP